MKPEEYPALWRASNAGAGATQFWFFFWLRLHLILLGVSGLLAAWNPMKPEVDHILSGAIALLMLCAFVVGIILRTGRLDDAWFGARAFAENAKSEAWRFMMKPAVAAARSDEEREFLEQLKRIRERFPDVEKRLAKYDTGGDELTPRMRKVRTKTLPERLNLYLKLRLEDQIAWYRSKGKANGEAETKWFFFVLVIELVAVVAAGVRVVLLHEYNPTGALAAMAASLLAWSHAKRFSDLAGTYSVACRDLNNLRARGAHVRDENELAAFVSDVETAISREHRVWIEKRPGG